MCEVETNIIKPNGGGELHVIKQNARGGELHIIEINARGGESYVLESSLSQTNIEGIIKPPS